MHRITKNLSIFFILTIFSLAINPDKTFALQCRDSAGNFTTPAGNTCPAGSSAIAELTDFETIFSNIVTISGILLGFAFFVMLVMGGIRYLMSGGDPKILQAAKGTITWAIVGLALFAIAFSLLLLIQTFTGVDVTRFRIIN